MRVRLGVVAGLLVAVVGVLGIWLQSWGTSEMPRPQSLILITLDTIRADRLGAYGHPSIRTPFVDGLAARGVLFERALTPVPLTLPSHTSLLTGTYPPRHGVRDNGGFVVPEELVTLAEQFDAEGFRTGAFVGAVVLDRTWGLDQGFEIYSGDFEIRDTSELISISDLQRPANDVVDDALAWLNSLGEEPFFAWVHLFDPHDPFEPPSPYRELYPGKPYLGEIAFSDSQMMRLAEWLHASGREESTMIVFAGDHGESFGEHREYGHGIFIYQETIRVPLIVVDPIIDDRGTRRKEPVTLVDVYPTVCERFGFEIPSQIQGQSLLPLIGGRGHWQDRLVYSETNFPFFQYGWSPLTSIQDRRYVYIESSEPELYDLESDPAQLNDIAGVQSDLVQRLKAQHDAFVVELAQETRQSGRLPDAETVVKLTALGYVRGGGGLDTPANLGELTPPRRRIEVHNRIIQARVALAAGDLDQAEELLDAARADDPNVTAAYSLLGRIRLKQGRPAVAAAVFEEGLSLKKDDLSLTIGLATARLQQGRAEDGILAIERAIERRPDDPQLVLLLGSFSRRAGHDEVAARALKRAVELDPESAAARLELAVLMIKNGLFVRAEAHATEALELDPNLPGAHLCLGQSLEAQNRFVAALAEYEIERDLAPDDHRPVYGMARLHGRMGHSAEERRMLAETVQLEPDFVPAYLYLARNLMASGESNAEAIELVEQAMDRHPKAANLALACYLLADLYNRMGDDRRSLEYALKGKKAEEERGDR